MLTADQIDWSAVKRDWGQRFKAEDVERLLIKPAESLIPLTCVREGDKLKPRLNKYIKITPFPKQEEFLKLDCLEAFYGGAGMSGKTQALLAAALQFADQPNYNALLIRRTFKELQKPDALLDLAHQWLGGTDARWRDAKNRYDFPTGATLTFGYMEGEKDKYQYTGVNWSFVGFDEVTQFTNTQYEFPFGWLRAIEGNPIPLRVRSASNPIGVGRLWAKEHFVDPYRRGDKNAPTFVPASIRDNPFADAVKYELSLSHLDPILRAQIMNGDWEAQAAGKFMRHWFKIVQVVPIQGAHFVRYWDLAATEPKDGADPDWTVGALMGHYGREYFIADIQRHRLTPHKVEQLVFQTAQTDRQTYGNVRVRMEMEPGSSGVKVIADYTALLAGYDFKGDKVTGPKEIRANALASQAEAGNVFMLAAHWNKDALDEFQLFPGGGHDDIVDACTGAFNEITGVPPINTKAIIMVGERLRPDW